MKLQGILRAELPFALVLIHIGQKDGADFSQLSFPTLGDMNNDCDSTTLTEGSVALVFDLNGMPCKIFLAQTNDGFTGKLDLVSPAFEMHEEITGTLIAVEPGFTAHHCIVPQENIDRLRAYNTYQDLPCEPVLRHELNNENVLAFVKEKGFDVENHHDFATMCALMSKVCSRISQDGVNYCHDRENHGTIAQILHAEKQNNITNCRGIAIILCGVLRAYGFKANYVECWPTKDGDQDIHVVCEAFAPDLGKTVLLDPSSNLYYMLDGQVLNLIELKNALVNGRQQDISFNADAAHGEEQDPGRQMLAYMSKNMVLLSKCIHSCEELEMDREDNCICLAPQELLDDDHPDATMRTANVRKFYTYK